MKNKAVEIKDENQDIVDIYEMEQSKMKEMVSSTLKVLPYVNIFSDKFKKYAVVCKDFSSDDVIVLKTRYTNDSCAVDVNLIGEVTDLISDEEEVHLEYFPITAINSNANIACPNLKKIYLPETLKTLANKLKEVEVVFCGLITPKWLSDYSKKVTNEINPYYSGGGISFEDALAEFELLDSKVRLTAENLTMMGDMLSKLSGSTEEEVYKYYLDTFIGYYGYKDFNSVLETQFDIKDYSKESIRNLALKFDEEIDKHIIKLEYSKLC